MIRHLTKRLSASCGINYHIFRRSIACSPITTSKQLNPDVANNRSYTPESGYVWKSGYEPIVVPDMTLDEYVWKNVAKWENKVAIVCGITGRKYTYAKLRDHCAAVAVRLQTQYKLKRGDIVAIALPNIPEYAIVVLGAMEAGLTITTINPAYTADEISRQLTMTSPKLIFGAANNVSTLTEAARISQLQVPIVAIKMDKQQIIPDGAIDFSELMNIKNIDFNLLCTKSHNPNDVCVIPFSSGTTGMPKGVMLTHRNIISNCEMINVPMPTERLIISTTTEFQDVLPSVLPFFHIYGLVVSLVSKLNLGCQIVTLPKFEPDSFLAAITNFKATYLNLVPPLIIYMGNEKRVTPQLMETVRMVMSGAAPLGEMDALRLNQKAPRVQFIQGFGMTEVSPAMFISHKGTPNFATIGWPTASSEAKIARIGDPNYAGVDVDEEGEVMFRSASVMLGYLNNKEATDDTIVQGGWLRSGDIGTYDADGFFYIKDRLKELIKVKGYQVPPAELEEILRDHPKLLDAGVIGVDHPKYGEAPRAFVVRKKGVNVTEKEIQEYVASKVSDYKRLTGGVQFIDAVPKSTTGKILRRELRNFKKE